MLRQEDFQEFRASLGYVVRPLVSLLFSRQLAKAPLLQAPQGSSGQPSAHHELRVRASCVACTGCLISALQETSCCNSPMDYTQQKGQSPRPRARKHSQALRQSLLAYRLPLPQSSSVLLYAYGCFAWMYECAPHTCWLPMRTRKRHLMP